MRNKYLYIVIFGLLLFVPFLGSIHLLDWDEANFAELAREMLVSGDYLQPQINFLPFYEKPPLFIWLQVLSMKVFGINEFGARFPNAICGILVLISLYYIGKKHFSERMAWMWVLSFGASIAPHFYFKTGLIDPFFNYFIFVSIYFLSYLFLDSSSSISDGASNTWERASRRVHTLRYVFLSAIFAALAIMTKGPVAIILICGSLGLGWVLLKFQSWKKLGWAIPWTIITLGLSGIWFWVITQKYGSTYVHEFIDYQIRLFQTEDAKHGGTILFHPIALLLGCFPASIFMWYSSGQKSEISGQSTQVDFQNILKKLMLSCGIVVLVVFSIVQTKIIHYSSMDYYPMTFFSALGLNYLIENKLQLAKWQKICLGFIFGVWIIALIFTPILGNHLDLIIPYIRDKNFLEQLRTPIQWHYGASIFGILVLVIVVYGFYQMKHQLERGILILFISCIVIIQVISLYYLPRIEKIVQGSLVEFCESKKNEDCYFQTLYIKSYNIYFYGNSKTNINEQIWNIDTMLNGKIHKDCYYITRTIDTSKIKYFVKPFLLKNGFVFYSKKSNI